MPDVTRPLADTTGIGKGPCDPRHPRSDARTSNLFSDAFYAVPAAHGRDGPRHR